MREKSLAQFESLSTSDEKAFESDCDQTMVGIVQNESDKANDSMKNFKTVCFFAKQTSKYNVEQSKEIIAGEK